MNKFNDNDIREALRRSEAKRQPAEVPGDFLSNVLDAIDDEADAKHKTIKLWRWVAAAACIALVAGIGSAILFADRTIQESEMIAETPIEEKIENQQSTAIKTDTVTEPTAIPEPKFEAPKPKAKPAAKPKPAAEPQPAPNPNLRMERPAYAETQPENNDTYLDPAIMDELILKMAEFQGVNKIKSECSITSDTNFVESFYVFPVKQDYDVLGRFVLMASQFSNTTPGYIFNNSEMQVFFTIDDVQNGLNYLWIAEQIDDSKIMIYSVHAPIDIEYKSDCFQQFHNDLTFANYNTYY